jgi:transposase
MTYSLDLRKKALKYIENGGTWKSASEIFEITTRTLANWLRKQKLQDLAPKVRRQSPSKIDTDKLKKYIEDHPDAYLREIAKEFGSTLQAIFYACKRLQITLKKRQSTTKKETKKNVKNLKKN